jgi:flagellin-like hook-associated protein FlgL
MPARPDDYFPWGDQEQLQGGKRATTIEARLSDGRTSRWSYSGGRYHLENGYMPKVPFYGAQVYGREFISLAGPAAEGTKVGIPHAILEDAGRVEAIDDLIEGVDFALKDMTTATSDLGAAKKRIDMQADFVSKLQDAIDRGVGQLVDADMNEESTRLQALQVQQQLGIQSLSIANANSQNILSLFR